MCYIYIYTYNAHICIYIYIHIEREREMCICVYVLYIIYSHRERERDKDTDMYVRIYIYIYMYVCIYIYIHTYIHYIHICRDREREREMYVCVYIQRLVEYGWKPQWGFSCHKNNSPCFFDFCWGRIWHVLVHISPSISDPSHSQLRTRSSSLFWHLLLALASTTNKQVCWGHHPRSLHTY